MTVHRLSLAHPGGETAILVGAGALRLGGELLADWCRGRTLFIVTTPRVEQLHGRRLAAVEAAAERSIWMTVEEGEAAKTLDHAGRLWREMLASGGKRDSRLLAFGGGSVGDLGGFVAGCFLRGIEVAQVPTTLLAQVDAALGGKTAVDLPAAKNSVGLFHHPALVVADTEVLSTLPAEALRAGLAEVVKMAYLLDPRLLARVEDELESLLAGEPPALEPVVRSAAAAKIGVVERDPAERSGERRLLNFGHTLGHALEVTAGYGELAHGDAVAYGMLFALRLATERGLGEADAERLRSLLARFSLPPLPPLPIDAVVEVMARDKKAREGGLDWVLPAAVGEGRVVEGIELRQVARRLPAFFADPLSGSGAGQL